MSVSGEKAMEFRLHQREQVDLNVRLIQKGHAFASAKAINFSKGGICIEQPDVSLNKGQILDLDLSKSGHPRGIRISTRAMVIYSDGIKVGLMFADDVQMLK